MQKIKFLSDMRARIQTIPTGGGGGGGGGVELLLEGGSYCFSREVCIASRGRFVPVFLLGNKWQLMIFMGTPCPLCLPPYQSFKQFGFTFYFLFFAGPGQFTWERSGSVVECLTRD